VLGLRRLYQDRREAVPLLQAAFAAEKEVWQLIVILNKEAAE
jgi:hypothetical protein